MAGNIWGQIGMAGVNILGGYMNAKNQRKQAKAQYEYQKNEATNAALNRASNNILRMTSANAARMQQWSDNKKKLDAMGKAWNEHNYNVGLQKDAIVANKFEAQLQSNAMMGAIVAQAAASGVGGASVEQVKQTEEMRRARTDREFDKQIQQLNVADREMKVAILDKGWNSLDMTTVFSDLDYTPKDLVIDTSDAYKYSLGKATFDGLSGFSGNMNNLGINLREFGYEGRSLFGGKSTSDRNTGPNSGALLKL